jgi:hypothetical protein
LEIEKIKSKYKEYAKEVEFLGILILFLQSSKEVHKAKQHKSKSIIHQDEIKIRTIY